jgi:hypothetical protein
MISGRKLLTWHISRRRTIIKPHCLQKCNIFAGTDSCVTIAETSKLGAACKADRADLRVDCVYSQRAVADQNVDPLDGMNSVLGSNYGSMKQHCPQCLSNMQAFVWPSLSCLPPAGRNACFLR